MSYSWRHVAPLSEQDRQIDLRDVDALQSAWLEFRSRLAETSAANLKAFNERLARQWSIETGILERLYDIDRGTTQVLIERGFVTDYLERSSTNHEPEQVMQILRDHQASVELIQDAVGNTRPLTVGLIQQLHATLTQHQETVAGLDQFGNPVQFRLRRGVFKELPNNPTRPNGVLHEYAPPIHVSAEMDNLVQWYNQAQGVNPLLLATWFHHRFTQIHPYQDGNGRVARALTNLILLKVQLLPVVITRDQRSDYIDALEQADAGNLKPLVRLFAEIEKKTILQALSLAPDDTPSMVIEDIADAIAERLRRRREAEQHQEEHQRKLRRVNEVAESLQGAVAKHLESVIEQVGLRLEADSPTKIRRYILLGGANQVHSEIPAKYQLQILEATQKADQKVNFSENTYYVLAVISSDGVPELNFMICFYAIGQELSGVMEITAFARFAELERNLEGVNKPFTLTYQDDADELRPKLLTWVDKAFAVALKQWGDIL